VLGVFGLGTLATALLYPPTNSDSLAYHMPRVLFWFQRHSVAFFPTVDPRQLFASPLTEYFTLTLKALAQGSDRLAGLVQWCSYVFTIIAVSLIAQKLGAPRTGQQAAAVVAATLPMAVLQASTQQNDLTGALWCLVAVVAVLEFTGAAPGEVRPLRVTALWAGIAGGLAVLTKPTAYLVLLPLFCWMAFASLSRDGLRRALTLVAILLACFGAVNGAWYARNAIALDGDFMALHAPGNAGILVPGRDPRSIATNTLKNTAMVFGTPVPRINAVLVASTKTVASLFGGDVDDPLTRLSKWDVFTVPSAINSNDSAPSPSTAALVVCALVVLAALPKKRRPAGLGAYAACAGAAFVLCAALLASNVAVVRLLIVPLLALTPLVGVATSVPPPRFEAWTAWFWRIALGLAVATGSTALLWGSTSPLAPWPPFLNTQSARSHVQWWNTSHEDLVFRTSPSTQAPFEAVAEAARANGIRRIGIVQHPYSGPYMVFIYSMMSLLPDTAFGYTRFTLLSDRIDAAAFRPQAILEIVPDEKYPAVLADGEARGAELTAPRHCEYGTILFYRAP